MSTAENTESQLCSGGRSIYRSSSFTHELKYHFFCHKAAETYFVGKVRAGLSSRLVKTHPDAVEVSGKVIFLNSIELEMYLPLPSFLLSSLEKLFATQSPRNEKRSQ